MKLTYLNGWLLCGCLLGLTSCSSDTNEDSTITKTTGTFEDVAFTYSSFELEVLKEVNNVRIENNLNALKIVNIVSQEALEHNQHMVELDEICHHNFDKRSEYIINTFNAIGVGENIAYGEATPKEAVQAWMDSEGHRKNILHESYTHFGISITAEDQDTYYYTNIFVIK